LSRARLPVPPLRHDILGDLLKHARSITKDKRVVKIIAMDNLNYKHPQGLAYGWGENFQNLKRTDLTVMKLGIIGLPQSGKTTVFNALTRGDQPTKMSGGRFEVHIAVVDVPDARVEQLSNLFHPQKTSYAKVTYADIAGLDAGSSDKNGLSGPLLNQLSQMDGFVHVVRCFQNPSVPHPFGSVDPVRDLNAMDSELLLNDLMVVERRLERLQEEARRGNNGRDRSQLEREIELFEKLNAAISEEIPLRDLNLSQEEQKTLSGFGLLSLKPVLVLLNLADEQEIPQVDYIHKHSQVVGLRGKLEMEIAQLAPDEAEEFMQEFGIEEPVLQRVIRLSYDLLNLQSFFTVGEDEVRAWTVQRGSSAMEAAGVIHSDLQKGFIRAEVIRYDELIALGGVVGARSKGKLRLEGKNYRVEDGEIVHIRFNV
jgi:GTP-binding protein YchF